MDFDAQADALKAEINRELWVADASTYGYFLHGAGPAEGKLEKYQEGTGIAFAVLFGVGRRGKSPRSGRGCAPRAEGDSQRLAALPGFFRRPSRAAQQHHLAAGERALGARRRHDRVATEVMADEIVGQAKLALASKDFREIYNAQTGAVDGGWQGGHWTSAEHQTWSATLVAARAVYLGVFGLQFERDGLRFSPHLPENWSGINLASLPYRSGALDLTLTGKGSKVTGILMDGKQTNSAFIPATDLAGKHRVEIVLAP